jgi:hypothetical protein
MGIEFTSGIVPMVWYFIDFHSYIDHLGTDYLTW